MQVQVKKWGNSASIRIPISIMQATRLKIDEQVDIHEEEGRIIIEPSQKKKYTLSQLLAGINKKNLHTEINFGASMGKEIF